MKMCLRKAAWRQGEAAQRRKRCLTWGITLGIAAVAALLLFFGAKLEKQNGTDAEPYQKQKLQQVLRDYLREQDAPANDESLVP